MIVLSGSDLFTSNVMVEPASTSFHQVCMVNSDLSQFMSTAFLHRRCTIVDLLVNWVVSFFGNLAGMLFFMGIITGCELVNS